MKNNIENNPVPSLVIEFNDDENIGWIQSLEEELILKYPHQIKKTKLQNGVESNKGKPCVACGTKTNRTKYGSNLYVCIDCSH